MSPQSQSKPVPGTLPKKLGDLRKGAKGRIVSVEAENEVMTQRLLEMGLLEGSQVELVHEAPFGGDPVAVRVRGALIALRRNEANAIQIIEEASHE